MIGYHLSAANVNGLNTMLDDMKFLKISTSQIYVRPPRKLYEPTRKFNNIDISIKYISDNGIKLFIHSAYGTNIIRSEINKVACLSILRDLRFSNKVGGVGTVVHVGSLPDINIQENLVRHLKYICQRCGGKSIILLENQVPCGNRRLTGIDEIIGCWNYIKQFPKIKKRVAFCIDICHLYAGHNINSSKMLSNFKHLHKHIPIKLVHFNGSMRKMKDEHDYPTKGLTNINDMRQIYNICIRNKIPMIIEMHKRVKLLGKDDGYKEYISVLSKIKKWR